MIFGQFAESLNCDAEHCVTEKNFLGNEIKVNKITFLNTSFGCKSGISCSEYPKKRRKAFHLKFNEFNLEIKRLDFTQET